MWGRIQSRTYQKKLETGEAVTKIAYEISISKMETVDEDGNSKSSTEVLEVE